MLSINLTDVYNVLLLCAPYLTALGIVLVLGVLAMVFCINLPKAKKYLVRTQAGIAMALAAVLILNLVAFGPMNTLISLATGSGSISDETNAEAQALCEAIADEGITLLANDGGLPLSGTKLNVFGWASTNPVYGGTGSGALSDTYPIVSLLDGLKNAGIETNAELTQFYTDYRADRPVIGMWEQDWTLPEPPASTYTDELIEGAKAFSDTALVVISRSGGEGVDVPTAMSTDWYNFQNNSEEYDDFAYYPEYDTYQHIQSLSQSERDMLDLVTANFDNVVVVYNGANAFELGFTLEYPQIKSVVWCPGTGQTGFNSLGKVLTGAVNPSGKTVDTFTYDLFSNPAAFNCGWLPYDNVPEFAYVWPDDPTQTPYGPNFVNYVESIYVGYKFYETAAAEGFLDYDATVQYPFGHGLSYTTFEQEMGPISVSDGNVTFDVTVTNTGDVAGKDVVQAYYNPPYYNGGIEKAVANLVAFDKTSLLEPGASETLTISFKVEDMASYDAKGERCWVLEEGDYGISIRTDSHNILDEQTYTVDETVVYDEGNPRSTDDAAAVNQFDHVAGDVTYLSRADGFANYDVATAWPENYSMSDEHRAAYINNSNYDTADYDDPNDVAPVTGADNGMTLADMRGKDYDDPDWELLLDQLNPKDMNTMISQGGYQTAPVKSVGKVQTVDCDGPASINNNFTRVGSIGFPSAVMISATWNEDLAHDFGESIGKMADEMGVSGWYAPAMNIHRTAFAGRNFEYYSEDGFLSGKMAAGAVLGAKEHGVYAYLKHFALNDQEDGRDCQLCTWADEQAIREIYLKPFEIAVKEGGAQAVMSSYNFLGVEWAGACDELLNTVLRDEWGFRGMVLTDYFQGGGYMDAEQAIRNGGDICLCPYDIGTNNVHDLTGATSLLAMRQACKNIMYTVVNSRAYAPENLDTGMPSWQIAAIIVDLLIVLALVAIELLVVRKGYAKRKAADALEDPADRKKVPMRNLVIPLVVIVAIIAAVVGWNAYSSGKDDKASAALADKGYLDGASEMNFQLDAPTTNAEVLTVLGRIAGDAVDQEALPADLIPDGWSGGYMAWGRTLGLVAPEAGQLDPVTAESFNTMVADFCAMVGAKPVTVASAGETVTWGEASLALNELSNAKFDRLTDVTYTTVTEGFDWGPAVTKVILDLGVELDPASVVPESFSVTSMRTYPGMDYEYWMLTEPAANLVPRTVVNAYLSDAEGVQAESGTHVTLELQVGPDNEEGSPFWYDLVLNVNKYVDDMRHLVTTAAPLQTADGKTVTLGLTSAAPVDGITLLADDFDTTGKYTYTYDNGSREIGLSYASWFPQENAAEDSTPLIIWLHGQGEGGEDPNIAILGNKVVNLITDDVQQYFGETGAAVLAPQAPTMWLDISGTYNMAMGTDNSESFYTEALMSLIVDFVKEHPEIDANRLYIGGCSNGGFMTINMLVNYPGAFAAAYPVCEPYANSWISEAKLQTLADTPIWLTAAKNDPVVTLYDNGEYLDEAGQHYALTPDSQPIYEYSNALFDRLQKAGAKDAHYSLFEDVSDTTGLYMGEDGAPYQYSGHWSWIYTLNNECEENGVSIFEWMAQQTGEGKLPQLPLEKKVYENPITFYLVRHGETEYNTQGLMQGWCDSPLTQNGIDLSKQLGEGLKDVDFVAAYSSDSGRAVDTAKNVLAGRNVPLTTTEDLREMYFGEVEGLPSEEVYTSGEIFAYCMWISGFDLFGGETWEGLGQRMHAALEQAALEHRDEGGNILISTHGMSILATLYNTVPTADGVMDQGEIDNCSVTILEWDNGVYTLKTLNDSSFLE